MQIFADRRHHSLKLDVLTANDSSTLIGVFDVLSRDVFGKGGSIRVGPPSYGIRGGEEEEGERASRETPGGTAQKTDQTTGRQVILYSSRCCFPQRLLSCCQSFNMEGWVINKLRVALTSRCRREVFKGSRWWLKQECKRIQILEPQQYKGPNGGGSSGI